MNSRLRIFAEAHPDEPLLATGDRTAMARELQRIGVTFEQWEAAQPIAPSIIRRCAASLHASALCPSAE